jgi:hypothetical protein
MQLCAVITRDELAALIGEIAPLDVELSRRPRRALAIGRPSLVELAPGAGLRVRGDARLTWDVAGVTVPVTVRACQLLLAPTIAIRNEMHVLAFEPRIEALEIGSVPGFVAEGITGALEGALEARKSKLAWPFERQLSLRKMLSERLSPPSRFELRAARGEVTVTASELVLRISFDAHVGRAGIGIAPGSRRSA